LRLIFLAFRTNLNFPPCFSLKSLISSDCIIIAELSVFLCFPLIKSLTSDFCLFSFLKQDRRCGGGVWKKSLDFIQRQYPFTGRKFLIAFLSVHAVVYILVDFKHNDTRWPTQQH
jgi:hypothetical protein